MAQGRACLARNQGCSKRADRRKPWRLSFRCRSNSCCPARDPASVECSWCDPGRGGPREAYLRYRKMRVFSSGSSERAVKERQSVGKASDKAAGRKVGVSCGNTFSPELAAVQAGAGSRVWLRLAVTLARIHFRPARAWLKARREETHGRQDQLSGWCEAVPPKSATSSR